MALTPDSEQHALQIQAGILGRRAGHKYEDELVAGVNELPENRRILSSTHLGHLFAQDPVCALVDCLCRNERLTRIKKITAISTGALATSEKDKVTLQHEGFDFTRCKSDLLVTLHTPDGRRIVCGVSVKRSANNAQLFLTTASAFSSLLRDSAIHVSEAAETGLKMFCGEVNYRPADKAEIMVSRKTDSRHFFWEELPEAVRKEWKGICESKSKTILKLLLRAGYKEDPYPPAYLLHRTGKAEEVAIYSFEKLAELSTSYRSFELRSYRVNKGSHRDPPGVHHEAPRFGIVQFQRKGSAQNATQLQFNLETKYYYKLEKKLKEMSANDSR